MKPQNAPNPPQSPSRPISDIRPLTEASVREGWLSRQMRLSLVLLQVERRLADGLEPPWPEGPRAWLIGMGRVRDALCEVCDDALAPPLEPLLTAGSPLTRAFWPIYTWADDAVLAIAELGRGAEEHAPRSGLPTMPAM